ncbi:MAG: hypothetical protein COA42_00165 [Alteromonadaceae bacterium]|nr:MAG: hypothetical protein COA42_00165 [Alteromonadaceae bacterium]
MDNLTLWYISIFAVDVAIAVAALIGLRYAMAWFTGVHVKDELDRKDNFAFGTVIAAAVVALALVLSAAVSGDVATSIATEALNVVLYCVVGIVLLKLGLFSQEKLMLTGFSIKEQLQKQNMAVAVVVSANLIAVGLIIRSGILWVEADDYTGLPALAVVFVVSQLVLMLVTLLRSKVYAKRHNQSSWQQAIASGNTALAIRYFGQVVATALVLTAIGGLVVYLPGQLHLVAVTWLGLGVAALLVLWVLYRIILPVLLTGVDVVAEVDEQQNIGVAWIEAAIFMAIAIILIAFLL